METYKHLSRQILEFLQLRGKSPSFFKFYRLSIFYCLFIGFFTRSIQASKIEHLIVRTKPEVKIYTESFNKAHSNILSLNKILSDNTIQEIKGAFKDDIRQKHEIFGNIYKLHVIPQKISSTLKLLNNQSEIVWAEPNHVFQLHDYPNDTLYEQQWALEQIEITQAWNIEKGDPRIIVGVVDTGIDYLHQDIGSQLWVNSIEDLNNNGLLDPQDINGIDDDSNGYIDDVIGWDFTDAPAFPDFGDYLTPDNDPMDEFPGGHGTPVSGIIAAVTNNHIGIAGIAPNVKIMALRAGTSAGFLEEDDVAEAILYAIHNGCKVVNMSFGDVVFSHLIKEVVEYGTKKGVLFVSSAGNSGNDILHFPAAYDETISVGATDISKNLAPFSSYGAKINVVAPGQDILSISPHNDYKRYSGTSFASSMVSGVISLIWSKNPQASPQLIKSFLNSGCVDLGTKGWDRIFGEGLINAYHSLIQSEHTIAEIMHPQTTDGTSENQIYIIGTAVGSRMHAYSLSYGEGENPLNLQPFFQGTHQIIEDTLGIWETTFLSDSVYTIELKVSNWDLSSQSHRIIVELDRTKPIVEKLSILPLIIENFHGYFIDLQTDDRTTAKLYYRGVGGYSFDNSISSQYFEKNHHFLISQQESQNPIECYFEIQNTADSITIENNDGQYYALNLNQDNLITKNFDKIDALPGMSYFLGETYDFDGDGNLEAIGNLQLLDQPDSRISSISYKNNNYKINSGSIPAFGRDIFDIDKDSYPELLAGFGGKSYLFVGTGLPEFSELPIEANEDDFWAARIYDFDNDGVTEVLAISQNQWHVYQLNNMSTFSVAHICTLLNPTAGENTVGVPYAGISDLNKNGKLNIVIGDYDGDIIVYEWQDISHIVPISYLKLTGEDATYRFALGDFDSNGLKEIAIATQHLAPYTGESFQVQQYWIFNIIKLNDNNELEILWEINFHGIVNQKGVFSGVSSSDYDGDQKDEIFFTPYPRSYYIQYENEEYQINWYNKGINSNVIPQIGNNQCIISSDSSLMVWEIEPSMLRPLPPENVWIESADTAHIQLSWSRVSGAQFYLIHRKDIATDSIVLFQGNQISFRDSLVQTNRTYNYYIQTVDSAFQEPKSKPSLSLTVRSDNPPKIRSFILEGRDQILIEFTEKLSEKSFQPDKFFILPDSIKPISVNRGKNSCQILLSFLPELLPGDHDLMIYHLFNQYNVPFFQDTFCVPFVIDPSLKQPYLKSVKMITKSQLLLIFNKPMDKSTVENIDNYRLEPDDYVVRAEMDSVNQSQVRLFLTGQNRMGSLGVDYYLEFFELRDIWGQPIKSDWGNRHLIKHLVNSLDNIIVYPNPLKQNFNEDKIVFGNLPFGAEIYIYTANGNIITKLVNEDYTGGVWWDLRNDAGEMVQNGVYIYVTSFQDQKKTGKFMIIR